jgi:hypothetical protein
MGFWVLYPRFPINSRFLKAWHCTFIRIKATIFGGGCLLLGITGPGRDKRIEFLLGARSRTKEFNHKPHGQRCEVQIEVRDG